MYKKVLILVADGLIIPALVVIDINETDSKETIEKNVNDYALHKLGGVPKIVGNLEGQINTSYYPGAIVDYTILKNRYIIEKKGNTNVNDR